MHWMNSGGKSQNSSSQMRRPDEEDYRVNFCLCKNELRNGGAVGSPNAAGHSIVIAKKMI